MLYSRPARPSLLPHEQGPRLKGKPANGIESMLRGIVSSPKTPPPYPMKNLFRTLLILATFASASLAQAAESVHFFRLDGKGKSQTTKCANSACTIPDLAPGDYTVTACTADGKPLDSSNAARWKSRARAMPPAACRPVNACTSRSRSPKNGAPPPPP